MRNLNAVMAMTQSKGKHAVVIRFAISVIDRTYCEQTFFLVFLMIVISVCRNVKYFVNDFYFLSVHT